MEENERGSTGEGKKRPEYKDSTRVYAMNTDAWWARAGDNDIVLKDPERNRVLMTEDIAEVSDGYHTFNELYAHRIELFIALCRMVNDYMVFSVNKDTGVWRSKLHSDGSALGGWFVLGIAERKGQQITYHLPIDRWEDCDFAETLERAPEFDGHTSADVLERLKKL